MAVRLSREAPRRRPKRLRRRQFATRHTPAADSIVRHPPLPTRYPAEPTAAALLGPDEGRPEDSCRDRLWQRDPDPAVLVPQATALTIVMPTSSPQCAYRTASPS